MGFKQMINRSDITKTSSFQPRRTITGIEIEISVQAKQEKVLQDTLIMQKVNHAHREAFRTRFPGQIEHCMRLTAERLQGLLTSKPEEMTNTMTWDGTPEEIKNLCDALYHLSIMNQHYPIEEE